MALMENDDLDGIEMTIGILKTRLWSRFYNEIIMLIKQSQSHLKYIHLA